MRVMCKRQNTDVELIAFRHKFCILCPDAGGRQIAFSKNASLQWNLKNATHLTRSYLRKPMQEWLAKATSAFQSLRDGWPRQPPHFKA